MPQNKILPLLAIAATSSADAIKPNWYSIDHITNSEQNPGRHLDRRIVVGEDDLREFL